MFCLDNTDTLEGGASVDAVVDYTVHGLVGSAFTVLADGKLSDTDPTVLCTAGAATSVISVTYVNTHDAAVNVNLYLDSANGGNPRRMIPKNYTLNIGASLCFDGQRLTLTEGVIPITYVKVSDTRASGTNGGTFTQDAWRTRTINTEDSDDDNICSVAANQIILEAGTYICSISATAMGCNEHKALLYNATDTSITLIGSTEFAPVGVNTHARIVGPFTIATQKAFEISHYCLMTKATTGFGDASCVPDAVEVYTTAEFWSIR